MMHEGLPLGPISLKDQRRFWAKVQIDPGPDGCWLWLGSTDPNNGYGKFRIGCRVTTAHRVAAAIKYKRLAAGETVDHCCINRMCVRPDHLKTATHAENSDDGRYRKANGHTSSTRPRCRKCGLELEKSKDGRWVACDECNELEANPDDSYDALAAMAQDDDIPI